MVWKRELRKSLGECFKRFKGLTFHVELHKHTILLSAVRIFGPWLQNVNLKSAKGFLPLKIETL